MEGVVTPIAHADAYRGKRVLLTGHTGFKGAWLAEWLLSLDADVRGLALPPPTQPSLFEQLHLEKRLDHRVGDIVDPAVVREVVRAARPDFVFHLAAQSLVRVSYAQPRETFATNVMGTVNVLEALRGEGRDCTVVVVTSDKCYENREWLYGYRETDPLGGHDPYSASKAATEMVTAAYRASYFSDGRTVAVASGRAGNVVGGGDWAVDRIVPDCVRALQSSSSIRVRNTAATRPWQHVLEPLSGYLALGSALDSARRAGTAAASGLASAFNFGPPVTSNRSVGDLVREILKHWPGRWDDASDPAAPHEAGRLALSADKAFHLLGWQSAWDFETTTRRTVDWYRRRRDGADAAQLVRDDIATYTASTSAAASAACGDA